VLVIPAIDILQGRCVRLLRGDYDQSTVYSDDPVATAAGFAEAGVRRLHVVDLDAARGSGDNRAVIEVIAGHSDLEVQVAGGIRSLARADAWLAAGAHAVVLGTAAVRDPLLLEACAQAHPGRVLAALDVRDGRPAVSGWTETDSIAIENLFERWDALALEGVILTCIDRDGTMEGPDLDTLAKVRALTRRGIQYSGGIASLDDVRRIAAAGATGCIIGKSLYEGRISLDEALRL
jgi:phosphoribosylformimino-5-aminoimidazole carboxamide ribotide isomerase